MNSNITVTLAFATDNRYAFFTQVALHSIALRIDKTRQCECVILADSLSVEAEAVLRRGIDCAPNMSLRVFDIKRQLESLGKLREDFTIPPHIQSYYRFFLPELLPEIDKVLYMDSDIVVMDDICKLFDKELDGFEVGAIHDYGVCEAPLEYLKKWQGYCRDFLGMKRPETYFNGGVMLMDLALMRKNGTSAKCAGEVRAGIDYQMHDQDIFNRLYDGEYLEIGREWNTMSIDDGYMKNASLIHYAGTPPWLAERGFRFNWTKIMIDTSYWWQVARQLPDFADMLEASRNARFDYLERLEEYYWKMENSFCWRLTAPLRWLINLVCGRKA